MSDMSMFDVDIEARPLENSLKDYQLAPSGLGEIGAAWINKPHRIVYDLIAAVKYYANEAAKQSMQGEAVTIWLTEKEFNILSKAQKTERETIALYTHAPDSAARIAELEAENEALRKQLRYCRDDYAYIPTQIIECTNGLCDWIRGRFRVIDASLNIKGGAE